MRYLIAVSVFLFFLSVSNAQNDTLPQMVKNLNSYNLKLNVSYSYGFGRKSFDREGMDIVNSQFYEDLAKSRPWMIEIRSELYKGVNIAYFKGESKMSATSSTIAWFVDENTFYWLREDRWQIDRQGIALIYEFRPRKNSLLTIEAGLAYAFSKLYREITLEGQSDEFDIKFKSNDVNDFAYNVAFRFPLYRNFSVGVKFMQYFGNYDYLNEIESMYGVYFEKPADDPHKLYSLKESCFLVTLNYDLFLNKKL